VIDGARWSLVQFCGCNNRFKRHWRVHREARSISE
jgi:hypothetical protein